MMTNAFQFPLFVPVRITLTYLQFLFGLVILTFTRSSFPSRDSLSGEQRTRDRKLASSNPGRSGRRIFFSRVNFCADSYSVSVPLYVTAMSRKRPRSFCQECRWQVTPKHAYTFDPTKSELSLIHI